MIQPDLGGNGEEANKATSVLVSVLKQHLCTGISTELAPCLTRICENVIGCPNHAGISLEMCCVLFYFCIISNMQNEMVWEGFGDVFCFQMYKTISGEVDLMQWSALVVRLSS